MMVAIFVESALRLVRLTGVKEQCCSASVSHGRVCVTGMCNGYV